MPNFCTKHLTPFTFGGKCPKCLESEVKTQQYAKPTDLQGRWQDLTSTPAKLNQDQFGICGMASAVYLLLRHNKSKAQELFDATFADVVPRNGSRTFNTANHEPIDIPFRYLARRYRLMEEAKEKDAPNKANQWINDQAAKMQTNGVAQPKIDTWSSLMSTQPHIDQIKDAFRLSSTFFVDFCVSRGLGYVFKKVAKSRYEGEKREFNLEFSEPQPIKDYRNFTHNGNLALRTNNLAFILKEILGATNIHIASKQGSRQGSLPLAPEVKGVTSSTFDTASALGGSFQNRLNGGTTFALAAVYSDIVKQGTYVNKDSNKASNTSLAYNHWVVVNGFKERSSEVGLASTHAELNIWTWAEDFTVHVKKTELASYFNDVIFGTL
jgi:hypothetical protein